MNNQTMTYDYTVVRQFAIMTVVLGIVGMLVGVLIASQMAWPVLNFDTPWLSFGRLRPLHTNAVVFGFGGSALFATSYYVVQRTCHVRLFAPALAQFTFIGWMLVIVSAVITPMLKVQMVRCSGMLCPLQPLLQLYPLYLLQRSPAYHKPRQ